MTDEALRMKLEDSGSMEQWTREFAVTREPLSDAVAAVGDLAADVELRLKGSRASTSADLQDRGTSHTG